MGTEHRLVHAELKTADQSLPLIGGINGPWAQELPGGKRRSLERNFYRQAHDATYAISDDMHELARLGEIPRISGKYYGQFDTVVCVSPDIPAGSRLDPYNHVDVVGYQQLLDLLITHGPKLAWTAERWAAFARHLQLVPGESDSPDPATVAIAGAGPGTPRRRRKRAIIAGSTAAVLIGGGIAAAVALPGGGSAASAGSAGSAALCPQRAGVASVVGPVALQVPGGDCIVGSTAYSRDGTLLGASAATS